jgi:hypothetical protein
LIAFAEVRNTSIQLSVPASHAKSGRTRTATCTLLALAVLAVASRAGDFIRGGLFMRVGLELFPALEVVVVADVPELVPLDSVLLPVLCSLATLFVSSAVKLLLLRVAVIVL